MLALRQSMLALHLSMLALQHGSRYIVHMNFFARSFPSITRTSSLILSLALLLRPART